MLKQVEKGTFRRRYLKGNTRACEFAELAISDVA